jgi:uncharacterized membrane protein
VLKGNKLVLGTGLLALGHIVPVLLWTECKVALTIVGIAANVVLVCIFLLGVGVNSIRPATT